MIFLYANYYYNWGFNVTCITTDRTEYNKHVYDNNGLLKSSSYEWEKYKIVRQELDIFKSYNWQNAQGLGVVLGFNNLRALDIDYCNDLSIIDYFLTLLNLPLDYKWVVKSGSQKGFHILFYCENHKYTVIDGKIKAFKPNYRYSNSFKHIELRWFGHLVLPPSNHHSSNNYQFLNGLPFESPKKITLIDLHALLIKYCSNEKKREIKSGSYFRRKNFFDNNENEIQLDLFQSKVETTINNIDEEKFNDSSDSVEDYIDMDSELDNESSSDDFDEFDEINNFNIKLETIDYVDKYDPTFLFYDYETFNAEPKGGRASQYASLRTDSELNLIKGLASNFFCEQADDNIPSITACLITKLTPQKILKYKNGIERPTNSVYCDSYQVYNEFEFIKNILIQMSKPITCTLGYNNYAFDDEFTRNLAYRNLFDPYEREWENGNTRFDVYFLVIATYVLRPQLIKFPIVFSEKDDSFEVSFKLEELTKANHLEHENAHDAFSDVVATILIMKLIKSRDEDFFNQIFKFRLKNEVLNWFKINNLVSNLNPRSFIHINTIYGKDSKFISHLVYVCEHPIIKTRLICIRIDQDNFNLKLDKILQSNTNEIIENIYSKKSILEEKGEYRHPITFIDINKCPILCEDGINSEKIDKAKIEANILYLTTQIEKLKKKLQETFNQPFLNEDKDSDLLIYSGFFNPIEKYELIKNLELAKIGKYSEINCSIENNRVRDLIFKFKARNFKEHLSKEELNDWNEYRFIRLRLKNQGAEIIASEFYEQMDEWRFLNNLTEREKKLYNLEILYDIEEWVEEIL